MNAPRRRRAFMLVEMLAVLIPGLSAGCQDVGGSNNLSL